MHTFKSTLAVLSVCPVGLSLGGCGSSSDEELTSLGCSEGAQVSCGCTDGTQGVQLCGASGAYGPCACGGATPQPGPSSPVDPTDPTTPVDPTDPTTPVDGPYAGVAACGGDPSTQPSPCVDEFGALRCKLNTGYAGDELALCALDPSEGMVIHFGPNDYDNPDEVAPFLLPPGGEEEICMMINTPNPTEQWVTQYHGRMRPNSHHLIVTMPQQHSENSPAPYRCSSQVLDRWLFGSQDPQIDVTSLGGGDGDNGAQPGDPDYGLAQLVPANQTLLWDFHNVNPSGSPELREAWASFQFIDPSEVVNQVDMIALYQLTINVPPLGQTVTQRKVCPAPADLAGQQQPVYVGLVTAHAHERMTRFSVYHETAGGPELVYESHDWAEPGNAFFRDGRANPPLPVDPGSRWGAKSGYLQINPGESLSFECEFQNNLDQWVGFGDTTNDEMCNVFGMYYPTVGGMWNCFF